MIFLWHNETQTSNNWAKIKLKGTISNSMAIGAVIELKPENLPTNMKWFYVVKAISLKIRLMKFLA